MSLWEYKLVLRRASLKTSRLESELECWSGYPSSCLLVWLSPSDLGSMMV